MCQNEQNWILYVQETNASQFSVLDLWICWSYFGYVGYSLFPLTIYYHSLNICLAISFHFLSDHSGRIFVIPRTLNSATVQITKLSKILYFYQAGQCFLYTQKYTISSTLHDMLRRPLRNKTRTRREISCNIVLPIATRCYR